MKPTPQSTRRDFLKRSALASTAVAVPAIWSDYTRGEDKNSQLTLASIGVGGSRGRHRRGAQIGHQAAKHAKMIACCDVDAVHAAEFAKRYDGIKTYKDYRKLFENEKPDIVTIGTPDHWHTPIAAAALRAGCDVYCEKPLTLTIDEGKFLCNVVKETGKVFQVGSQQRSEFDQRFLKAIAIVQSGRLGDKIKATASIGGAPVAGLFDTTEPPKDLDWDMWVGPAPKVPYTKERCHANFRWWLEYSGGKMTDWGAHHIDIAQWALGADHSGPVEIEGQGAFPDYIPKDYDPVAFFAGEEKLPNGYNTAVNFSIDLRYDGGNKITVSHEGNGILFEGDKGRIFVNRGKLTGAPVEEMTGAEKKDLDAAVAKLYRGKRPGNHMNNFFECVKDRSLPISDIHTHHRSMTSCHMCNIVLLLKRKLRWDPKAEQFLGDDQANALKSRPSRKPYGVS